MFLRSRIFVGDTPYSSRTALDKELVEPNPVATAISINGNSVPSIIALARLALIRL
jgi:hypothetical protein